MEKNCSSAPDWLGPALCPAPYDQPLLFRTLTRLERYLGRSHDLPQQINFISEYQEVL